MVIISISVIAFNECNVLAGILIKSPLLQANCSLSIVIIASPFGTKRILPLWDADVPLCFLLL